MRRACQTKGKTTTFFQCVAHPLVACSLLFARKKITQEYGFIAAMASEAVKNMEFALCNMNKEYKLKEGLSVLFASILIEKFKSHENPKWILLSL